MFHVKHWPVTMGGQIDLMTSLCPSNLLEERASTSQSTEHGMGSIRPQAIYSTNEGRCTVPTTPTESPREERAGVSKSASRRIASVRPRRAHPTEDVVLRPVPTTLTE